MPWKCQNMTTVSPAVAIMRAERESRKNDADEKALEATPLPQGLRKSATEGRLGSSKSNSTTTTTSPAAFVANCLRPSSEYIVSRVCATCTRVGDEGVSASTRVSHVECTWGDRFLLSLLGAAGAFARHIFVLLAIVDVAVVRRPSIVLVLAAIGAPLLTAVCAAVVLLWRHDRTVPHGPSMCLASAAAVALGTFASP